MTGTKQLDLEKLVKVLQYVDMGHFVAFVDEGDEDPDDYIEPTLESIKEALNEYKSVFLEIGYWGYDDEYSDEPCFMINGSDIEIDGTDSYYSKYHYLVAGYGIFVDKELNVEYGYYTTEAPPTGHGAGYTTFHDFTDAREEDVLRDELISRIDASNIWK